MHNRLLVQAAAGRAFDVGPRGAPIGTTYDAY